jgi:hypothetical protein
LDIACWQCRVGVTLTQSHKAFNSITPIDVGVIYQ